MLIQFISVITFIATFYAPDEAHCQQAVTNLSLYSAKKFDVTVDLPLSNIMFDGLKLFLS